MAHKKVNLDSKICIVCDKPFAWRKKWQNCWDDVKYCSERCRRSKPSNSSQSYKNLNGEGHIE